MAGSEPSILQQLAQYRLGRALYSSTGVSSKLSSTGIVNLLIFSSLFYLAWALIQALCRYQRVSHIPGPWLSKISGLNLVVRDVCLQRNETILEWHKKYGPIVCIAPNAVSVASLSATREIYGSTGKFSKSSYFDHFKGYNARSVFATLPHQEHQAKRRHTSQFYQASNIYGRPEVEDLTRDRLSAVLRHVECKGPNPSVDVYSLTDWYGFDIITRLILGPRHCTNAIEEDSQERGILRGLKHLQFWGPLHINLPGVFQILVSLLSWIPSLDYLQAEDELAVWSYDKVKRAIEDPLFDRDDCLLRRLVAQCGGLDTKEARAKKSFEQNFIAAEVLDNINAAEATLSVTATYLLYHLSFRPQWQEKVREELSNLPVQADGFPSFSHINETPILEACMKEVYRLHPASSGRSERVVPSGGRKFSGVYVPEETVVTTSITALHQTEDVFPAPDQFLPERWLQDQTAGQESHLIPFGYGARICLGKPLATLEIKVLIAGIFLRYRTRLSDSFDHEIMKQCSTHDAVPSGLRCPLVFEKLQ
ncbi:uncharacterized protein GIQ15_04567 [Arthroderma uncinatum]|uniref:uncharacterized protein n=1 Tax=Arthroderma uncinatum TaxID=74035 RepID=UPI00144A8841|nr:uncharacterized protein GIQ15_04567 [Arthroderma uncinatum]KAF3481808.1 hypothetical protein GIQ15_04567 [Arthroderma uncinatum]